MDILSEREAVAWNPNTPGEVLARLAKDEDEDVREAVAWNPNTPGEALAGLAEDEDEDVRAAVAGNPSTPREVLAGLAEDEDEDVRAAVAGNPSTPREVLAGLAEDEDEDVRWYVAQSTNTMPEVLAGLAADEDRFVRVAVAQNTSTPGEVLAGLAADEDWHVRWYVAQNPSTPSGSGNEMSGNERTAARMEGDALAQAHATFDASDRIVASGEAVGQLVAIDGEWFVATGLGWKSKMAAVEAWQHEALLQTAALRAIRACRKALTETARYEVLEALVACNGDDEAGRLWHAEALGFDDGADEA
ncbi:MAG: HEAT repeat domain-containing protein [Acidimicrobiales bacterium]